MNKELMIALLVDFYREAQMDDAAEVIAWCQAKGVSKAKLDEAIKRWGNRHAAE